MTISNLGPIQMATNHGVTDGQMTQPLELASTPSHSPMPPVLRVFGVGGGGCNAVNRMCRENLGGVEYYGINTDSQHLGLSQITHRRSIGQKLTRGLGVGGNPELGRQAAEESRDELTRSVAGADMVFIAAGMGGGTGTGAAPVIAQIAKESGALTIAVVSKPFSFESSMRSQAAELGIATLKEHVDTLIVIPNDRLLQLDGYDSETFTWDDALKLADSVLQQGIQAVAEVITVPGDINVDFADVKTIMSNAGPAWLAIGTGKGEHRAIDAAHMAVKSPLLDIELAGARRILFVITGGSSLTLKEVHEASAVIQEMADPEANVIFGTCKDPSLEDEVKVTLVASAFPVAREVMGGRQDNPLDPLLPTPTSSSDELELPSFLRKQAPKNKRGLFR